MSRGDALRAFQPRLGRVSIVLAGIVVCQAIFYGPSLVGRKILLPLDILAQPGHYLPWTPEMAESFPHNPVLADLVLATEPGRRFLGEEIRAGRFPLWNPYQFAGVPNSLPKFSPFVMLGAFFESPKVLAWVELLAACVSGLGMYAFSRWVLRVGFWPAACVAWCHPLTAFFVFWLGYGVAYPVVWLPWLLAAVHQTVRERSGLAGIGVAVTTGLVLVSGRLDVAGQVMLVSGLFATWCYLHTYHRLWFNRQALRAGMVLVLGWALGFMLAAPDYLTMLDYTQTGSRMIRRSAGEEDQVPVGLAALPEVVLPNIYGATERGTSYGFPRGQINQLEGSAGSYAGLLAALLAAPLAWCSRRHRAINAFLAFLALFALSWCLNLPLFVNLLRLPVLNMMSHNRLVFAAAFAILALAAVGLEALREGHVRRRWWFCLPAGVLVVVCLWSLDRAFFTTEPIVQRLDLAVRQGHSVEWIRNLNDVQEVRAWFVRTHLVAASLGALGAGGWLILSLRRGGPTWIPPLLGAVMLADLLNFGFGRNAQSDPAQYYPRIPVLEEVKRSIPGRVLGQNCLPAALAQTQGLRDIRGYDAVDPARLMDLMAIAADTRSPRFSYALTQWFMARAKLTPPNKIRLSPVLDMLGVRYVIFRGSPPANIRPAFEGDDYWVMVNQRALPRVFVPKQVKTVADDRERLAKLTLPQFDPQEVAYVESAVDLPPSSLGAATIVEETPRQIKVSARMRTAGLLVLADLWDPGWEAYVDGRQVPILRTNHAVRGVEVPAGSVMLEFRHEPRSLLVGLKLSALALLALMVWLGSVLWRRRSTGAASHRSGRDPHSG